jgi:hypothetical protein
VAQSDADRRAVRDRLLQIQRRQLEADEARRRRADERRRLERVRGLEMSDECLNNPVCRDAAQRAR